MIGGDAIGEAVAFVRELYQDWKNGKPQREQEQRDEAYDRDINRNAQAAATGDAAQLTHDFEAERQAAIGRGDIEPAPTGDRRDRLAPDSTGPADQLRQLP